MCRVGPYVKHYSTIPSRLYPEDQLCQLASKWLHSFSKYRVHKFGNRQTNERTDERTDRLRTFHYASAWQSGLAVIIEIQHDILICNSQYEDGSSSDAAVQLFHPCSA